MSFAATEQAVAINTLRPRLADAGFSDATVVVETLRTTSRRPRRSNQMTQTRRNSKRGRTLNSLAIEQTVNATAGKRRRPSKVARSCEYECETTSEIDLSLSEHFNLDLEAKEDSSVDGSVAETDDDVSTKFTYSEIGSCCFICMGTFNKKNPASRIPCISRCNDAPVHAKCIYEWRECQTSKSVGSCPLCRSKLERVLYTPPDVIRSWTFDNFYNRRSFMVHPVPPEAGVVRCYVRAERTGFFSTMTYELYLQAPTTLKYPLGPLPDHTGPRDGDRLLAVARKQLTSWGCSQLDMSMDPHGHDYDDLSENYLGCVQSSFTGLDHVILAPHRFRDGQTTLCELGAVRYMQNRIRSALGPRKLDICLPKIEMINNHDDSSSAATVVPTPSRDSLNGKNCALAGIKKGSYELFGEEQNDETKSIEDIDSPARWATSVCKPSCNQNLSQTLYQATPEERLSTNQGVLFGKNKEPYWLESIEAFSLDFQGRVTLPSNKNFQILMENVAAKHMDDNNLCRRTVKSSNSSSSPALQFGKVQDNQAVEIYTMDVQWPLSPLQAFGICLTACDRKLLCS